MSTVGVRREEAARGQWPVEDVLHTGHSSRITLGMSIAFLEASTTNQVTITSRQVLRI